MEENIIELNTKADLDIYMSPIRQQLLRRLNLSGGPQTPKALSLALGISPSSVQHHLKKLLSLGLVKVDHTALINGITATYYAATDVTVRLGMGRQDLRNEREALVFQLIQDTVQGYFEAVRRAGADWGVESGDAALGVAYLTEEDWAGFLSYYRAFLEAHKQPATGTSPWDFALVAYQANGQS